MEAVTGESTRARAPDRCMRLSDSMCDADRRMLVTVQTLRHLDARSSWVNEESDPDAKALNEKGLDLELHALALKEPGKRLDVLYFEPNVIDRRTLCRRHFTLGGTEAEVGTG